MLKFSKDFDVEQDGERTDTIKEAYKEALKLAQYALKNIHQTPLDQQIIPALFFPKKYLPRNGPVEKILSFLSGGDEKYWYIFNDITVFKDTKTQMLARARGLYKHDQRQQYAGRDGHLRSCVHWADRGQLVQESMQ